jgi:hypothetical protein
MPPTNLDGQIFVIRVGDGTSIALSFRQTSCFNTAVAPSHFPLSNALVRCPAQVEQQTHRELTCARYASDSVPFYPGGYRFCGLNRHMIV